MKSLVMSEERFSKAFHESPLPSGIQSFPDQRFVDVNQRFVEVSGYQREELIGRTAAELFLWEKPASCRRRGMKALCGRNQVRDKEAKLRTLNGELREMLVSLSPVALGGQTACAVAGAGRFGAGVDGTPIAPGAKNGGHRPVGRRRGARFQ